MCTTPDGTYYKDSEQVGDISGGEVDAMIGFGMDRTMWKNRDFRCLKPKSKLEPEYWPHYEMKGFRAAKTKDELENIEEVEFDKFFFNLEDPKVFNEMVKGENRKKVWKKTYGFDFVSFNDRNESGMAFTKCYKHCLKAEYKEFAKKCRKNGGFFKCCMTM